MTDRQTAGLLNFSEWDLPDEAYNRAMQFETDQTISQLDFGRFINEMAEEYDLPPTLISRKLAAGSGGNANTYRDYAWIAAAVTPEIQDLYPLSLSQFRACLQGADFLETVKWAAETYPDQHNSGKPAPYEAIMEFVNGNQPGGSPVTVLRKRYDSLSRAAERFATDDRLPLSLRRLAAAFIQQLEKDYLEYLEGTNEKDPPPD